MKFFVTLFIFFTILNLSAEPAFVQAIPNGTKNQCLNCHFSLLGGVRNIFGSAFESNGKKWNAILAKLDTDNDGVTNGAELQDPEGAWKIGNANPGTSSLVTNPSDVNDFPTSIENDNYFAFVSFAPLPAKNNINFSIQLKSHDKFEILVYNQMGELVKSFMNFYSATNQLNFSWDLTNEYGVYLPNGLYFFELRQSGIIERRKFLIER